MAVKIFMCVYCTYLQFATDFDHSTGATGYIGGDALYALYHAYPEYSYTAIVRNSDKGAPVAAKFPKIRLVYGDMDSSALIEEECANADIVIRLST